MLWGEVSEPAPDCRLLWSPQHQFHRPNIERKCEYNPIISRARVWGDHQIHGHSTSSLHRHAAVIRDAGYVLFWSCVWRTENIHCHFPFVCRNCWSYVLNLYHLLVTVCWGCQLWYWLTVCWCVYRNIWTFVMRSCAVTTYWLSKCWGENKTNVVKLLKQLRVGWDESEGFWVGNEINFAVFLIFVTGGVSFLITKCQGQPQSSLSIHHWYW